MAIILVFLPHVASIGNAAVAYSPDGTFMYVYSPVAWDQASFPNAEYTAVANFIKDQNYDVTTVVYRDTTTNDDLSGSATLANFKNMKFSDLLYVMTHGNVNMMAGIYLKTSAAVDTWRNNEGDTTTVQSGAVMFAGNPAFFARVPAAWYTTHWKSILDQSRAIAILSSCTSSPNITSAVVSAAGGGVSFGYAVTCTGGQTSANNKKLLERMNGTTDGATKRKAGQAYGGGAGYAANFTLFGAPDITLCPAYESKSPLGHVAQAGSGHFQVDTYCHDTVPATDALTFAATGNVAITNVNWVGSDKVNRIEFDWTAAGTGCWSVTATAHADKFHSWGAATSTYHEMDGNRVTPNGDDVVWAFENCPLAVTLAAFEAEVSSGVVILSWSTEAEVDNEGFRVLRNTEPYGEFEIVSFFVPAEGGPAFGTDYQFADDAVEAGVSYYYLLEDIDTSGASTLHGADACTFDSDPNCEPVAVTVPGLSAAEFCAAHEIRSRSKKDRRPEERACKEADWRDNEGRHPRDCKVAKGGGRGKRAARACVARADAG